MENRIRIDLRTINRLQRLPYDSQNEEIPEKIEGAYNRIYRIWNLPWNSTWVDFNVAERGILIQLLEQCIKEYATMEDMAEIQHAIEQLRK